MSTEEAMGLSKWAIWHRGVIDEFFKVVACVEDDSHAEQFYCWPAFLPESRLNVSLCVGNGPYSTAFYINFSSINQPT